MENAMMLTSILVTSLICLVMLFTTFFFLKLLVTNLYYKKKQMYAIMLIKDGFEIVTVNNGVPHLLKRGEEIIDVWKGKKEYVR